MDDKFLNILRQIASQSPAGLAQGASAAIPGGNQASMALAKLMDFIKTIDAQKNIPQQAQPMPKQSINRPDATASLDALRNRIIQGQYQTSDF